MTETNQLTPGTRVVATDGVRRSGTLEGTVLAIIGAPRVGGGPHARVQWDNGHSGKKRLDHLERVS